MSANNYDWAQALSSSPGSQLSALPTRQLSPPVVAEVVTGAALNRSSGLHTLQLHHDPTRQPGRANALLQAIASALGAVLIAHAFVHPTVVSYLAYIANLPLSCVFRSSASPRAVPGVFDVTATQSGWWWRENAAQAA